MKTDISIVLDRSGSMSSIREATIRGINDFVEAQKKVAGECALSLVQFDDQYDVVYTAKLLADVPDLTAQTFEPRGMTALLDAIGRTINKTGERLANMAESDRPKKVIFVIMTDGAENVSKEFTRAKVNEMISHQRSMYQWEFVFLGANQDAIAVGASLGIAASSTMTYSVNAAAVLATSGSTAAYVSNLRSGKAAAFSDTDRINAMTGGAQ
jgi:hypothetical protein